MMNWFDIYQNRVTLAYALEEIGEDVGAEFVEKPWKWENEWNYYQEHNTLEGFE